MMGQSSERMRSERRRQEMADSSSSPSHPGSLVVPGRDLRQIGGGEGEGHGLGLHVVLIRPISTRETAAAYTGLLGCDLSKFFYINSYEFKD